MTVNLTLQLTFIHSFRIQLEVKVSTREDLRALEESETRILLLYATRPEGENIMQWAKEAGLTSKSYIWVATQSVIGESRDASPDLPAGMLGKCMKESTLMCQIKNEKHFVSMLKRLQNVPMEIIILQLSTGYHTRKLLQQFD